MSRPSVRAERRAEILVAFARVLSKHGFAGATMAAVASEAGVAPGLLHHHFVDKDDMMNALMDELVRRFRARVHVYESEADPLGAYVDGALKLDERADTIAARCWASLFAEAIRNLPELIARAAGRRPFGIMIARGDLAVEIGFERLAEMQEEILWLCEAAAVPAIWATQVLEGLVADGIPTRGEMTDAAMGVRAECVMLNKGPHLVQAIELLDRLLGRMDDHMSKKTAMLRALRSW